MMSTYLLGVRPDTAEDFWMGEGKGIENSQ